MFDLVILVLLNTLYCSGIYIAAEFEDSDEFDKHPDVYRNIPIKGKMIFWFIRYYGSYLPTYFRYPLYYCLPCMGSIWSIPITAVFSFVTGLSVVEGAVLWMLQVPVVVTLNYLIKKYFLF